MARIALDRLNYCHVRHMQRYEYILTRNYVLNKTVVDIGCGNNIGTYALSSIATKVYGVDRISLLRDNYLIVLEGAKPENIKFFECDLFDFKLQVDVCVAVEVFEHILEPQKLIRHLASLGEWLFITTPLVESTGRTVNMEHVAEYSSKDFDKIISKEFNIVEKVYQKSNLEISYDVSPNGDSFNPGHVVQMVWARRK